MSGWHTGTGAPHALRASGFREAGWELGEALDFEHFMEEPGFVVLGFEDDGFAGVFDAVMLLPFAEAVDVAAPVEAFEEGGLLIEVETHGGRDAAADFEAEAGFAFIGEIGDDFDFRFFIDQDAECPGPDVVLRGLYGALLFIDPPPAGHLEHGFASGALFTGGGLGRAAKVEHLFHAEDFEQLVLAADGADGFFNGGLGVGRLALNRGDEDGGEEQETKASDHGWA